MSCHVVQVKVFQGIYVNLQRCFARFRDNVERSLLVRHIFAAVNMLSCLVSIVFVINTGVHGWFLKQLTKVP